MLCHLQKVSVLGFVVLIFTYVVCHTVAETISNDSNLKKSEASSSAKRLAISSDSVENLNLIQNSVADERTVAPTASSNETLLPVVLADGGSNITQSLPKWMATIKSGALERTGLVFLGFMLIIIVFFVARGIRLRHKRSKSRKYGIITSTDMEMEPLDKDDDEEEDLTLYDAQHKYTVP